jgi:2-oxoisovalerate dehydrogenase E2 component (dihydrolipoyl transacylase)
MAPRIQAARHRRRRRRGRDRQVARRRPATTVKEHQAVVEVMTDKATVEIPAPAAGKITSIRAKAGDVVPVGSVLFVLETAAARPRAEGARRCSRRRPGGEAGPPPAIPRPRAHGGGHGPSKAGGGLLEFKLPDIGEGVAEGEIVKWLVNAGATVKEHQAVVEVMTDKATVEIPAPAGGQGSLEQRAQGRRRRAGGQRDLRARDRRWRGCGPRARAGTRLPAASSLGSAAAPAARARARPAADEKGPRRAERSPRGARTGHRTRRSRRLGPQRRRAPRRRRGLREVAHRGSGCPPRRKARRCRVAAPRCEACPPRR